jgi:hypothetical protein
MIIILRLESLTGGLWDWNMLCGRPILELQAWSASVGPLCVLLKLATLLWKTASAGIIGRRAESRGG